MTITPQLLDACKINTQPKSEARTTISRPATTNTWLTEMLGIKNAHVSNKDTHKKLVLKTNSLIRMPKITRLKHKPRKTPMQKIDEGRKMHMRRRSDLSMITMMRAIGDT